MCGFSLQVQGCVRRGRGGFQKLQRLLFRTCGLGYVSRLPAAGTSCAARCAAGALHVELSRMPCIGYSAGIGAVHMIWPRGGRIDVQYLLTLHLSPFSTGCPHMGCASGCCGHNFDCHTSCRPAEALQLMCSPDVFVQRCTPHVVVWQYLRISTKLHIPRIEKLHGAVLSRRCPGLTMHHGLLLNLEDVHPRGAPRLYPLYPPCAFSGSSKRMANTNTLRT